MLLGVEHIQFCVRDLDAARSYLEGVGYETVFEQRDFDRAGLKLPHYRSHGRSMVYLRGPDSALELVDGESNAGTTGYLPILPSSMAPADAVKNGAPYRIGPLDTDCVLGEAASDLCALRLATPNLAASIRFWETLGGRVDDSSSDPVVLSFAARIATMPLRLSLIPIESKATEEPMVDELGCRLVAMLSTSLETDLKHIEDAGGHPSEVRALEIHGRKLRVCFVRTPSGELVEIMEPQR